MPLIECAVIVPLDIVRLRPGSQNWTPTALPLIAVAETLPPAILFVWAYVPIAAPLPVLEAITFPSGLIVAVPPACMPVIVPPPVTEMLPEMRLTAVQSL